MPVFEMQGTRTYVAHATLNIKADSYAEAEAIMDEVMGNHMGGMQFDPGNDTIDGYESENEVIVNSVDYDARNFPDIVDMVRTGQEAREQAEGEGLYRMSWSKKHETTGTAFVSAPSKEEAEKALLENIKSDTYEIYEAQKGTLTGNTYEIPDSGVIVSIEKLSPEEADQYAPDIEVEDEPECDDGPGFLGRL